MIPTLGNITELSQGIDGARQGAVGRANTAVGGAFGDILHAETGSGGADDAAAQALANSQEGGKNLLPSGKELPGLPPVAGLEEGIVEGLDQNLAEAGALAPDSLPVQVAAVSRSEHNPLHITAAHSEGAVLVASTAEVPTPTLWERTVDSAGPNPGVATAPGAPLTDELTPDTQVAGPAPVVSGLTSEVRAVPTASAAPPNPVPGLTPENASLLPVSSHPLPAAAATIDPTLTVAQATTPLTPPPLSRSPSALNGPARAGGFTATLPGQSLSSASHGEKLASGPVPTITLAALADTDAPIAVREQIVVDSAEVVAGVELTAVKPAAAPAAQAQGLTSLLAPAISESSAALAAKPALPTTLPPMTTAVGDAQWHGEMAGRLSVMLKNGTQEATLKLNPPELGRLDIRIATEGDQARIVFSVQNPEARDALEQSMPRLREMFEQGGLQLARSDVSDQSQSRARDDNLFADDADGVQSPPEQESPERVDWLVPGSNSQVDYYV